MIGVVGLGVVGAATAKLFASDPGHERPVQTYDVNGSGNCGSLKELADKVAVTFVCVPTPQGLMNRLDTSILSDVCQELQEHADGSHVTVVRSTVPIGTCKNLRGCVVYNPEFCNARTALADMLCAKRVVLGGPEGGVKKVRGYYDWACNYHAARWATVETTWENAEALKLVTNSAMAAKIAFANEAAILCHKLGADWNEVSRLLALDERLGSVGFQVPGPDGKMGFGGACLPKDLSGFIAQQTLAGTPSAVSEAARRTNTHIRKAMDAWAELIANLIYAEGEKK